jgi:7,8-dihydroneopterin aldolase/epimerase/oxygenase
MVDYAALILPTKSVSDRTPKKCKIDIIFYNLHLRGKNIMDSIEVTGIRCYGYTGYLPEEQILGQWFEVDVTVWTDLQPSGENDNLADTLDYREVINIVKNLVKNSKFALIEKLINAIASELLTLEKVEKVRVKLSKLAAPIPDFGGKITLDITRTK